MNINKITQLRQSIRWNLFITLGLIMLVCQTITVIWLWHESKEQIDVLVDLTLSKEITDAIVREEELEAIFALFLSTFTIMSVTLFLSYKAIKCITKPLESLEKQLVERTAENLKPIQSTSNMKEIKSITSALNGLFYRLDETLQQERLFTADVAHELRTPLAGIRLHLELLEKTKQIDCQELIERIDRLVNTIEQLLILARASQKFIVGQYQHIQFKSDVEIVMNNELVELTKQKQQSIIWIAEPLDISFSGDKTLIRLLVRNLVENAYRYSPVQTTIIVRCYEDEQHIIIEVKDQGPGIDENKIVQLTQAFYRMDRRHKGLGLGLSIVNRIITLHQGQLILRNRSDGQKGTIAQCRLRKQIN